MEAHILPLVESLKTQVDDYLTLREAYVESRNSEGKSSTSSIMGKLRTLHLEDEVKQEADNLVADFCASLEDLASQNPSVWAYVHSQLVREGNLIAYVLNGAFEAASQITYQGPEVSIESVSSKLEAARGIFKALTHLTSVEELQKAGVKIKVSNKGRATGNSHTLDLPEIPKSTPTKPQFVILKDGEVFYTSKQGQNLAKTFKANNLNWDDFRTQMELKGQSFSTLDLTFEGHKFVTQVSNP